MVAKIYRQYNKLSILLAGADPEILERGGPVTKFWKRWGPNPFFNANFSCYHTNPLSIFYKEKNKKGGGKVSCSPPLNPPLISPAILYRLRYVILWFLSHNHTPLRRISQEGRTGIICIIWAIVFARLSVCSLHMEIKVCISDFELWIPLGYIYIYIYTHKVAGCSAQGNLKNHNGKNEDKLRL